MKNYKGYIIAFEGIDGSGKTTIATNTKKRIEKHGFQVAIFKEPTNETDAGKKIRASYNTERPSFEIELQWFIEDRTWDVKNRILPALAQNQVVFMDRYYYSTACYQGVRNNNNWKAILDLNRKKFPEPDLTIIFDINPDIALKRILSVRNKINSFEVLQNLINVRNLFLEIYNKDKIGNFVLVDGSKSIRSITTFVTKLILNLLNRNP